LFIGEMACLGLFYSSLRTRSLGLFLASMGLLAAFGAASLLLTCPNCAGRIPVFSKEALDLFNPRWKCRDCDHEL